MDPEQPTDPGQGEPRPESAAVRTRADGSQLGRELGGDLPCVVCGYNLRGLSIRGLCPECGAGVRATILAVVDPHASVLQPIPRPRMVAGGLVLWTAAGLATALLCWAPHLTDALIRVFGPVPVPRSEAVLTALVLAGAIGAAGVIRPHRGISPWFTLAAILAVLLHLPLGWALLQLHAHQWPVSQRGTWWVVIAMASLAAIFLLMRPTVRLLVARSLLLRSGRVDRQTLYGMAAAAALIALGQLVLRYSIVGWTGGNVAARVLGTVLLVTGAALLTLGLFGSLIDGLRIARAIIYPLPTLRQVLRGTDKAPRSEAGARSSPGAAEGGGMVGGGRV